LIAVSAVHWPCSVWLEGNFAFLSAVGAGCLVHLFLIHSLFQLLSTIMRKSVFLHNAISVVHVLNLSIPEPSFAALFMEEMAIGGVERFLNVKNKEGQVKHI